MSINLYPLYSSFNILNQNYCIPLPILGVAQLRFGVVKDVFPCPGGGLLTTQDLTQLGRGERVQLLHGEHQVETLCNITTCAH